MDTGRRYIIWIQGGDTEYGYREEIQNMERGRRGYKNMDTKYNSSEYLLVLPITHNGFNANQEDTEREYKKIDTSRGYNNKDTGRRYRIWIQGGDTIIWIQGGDT